MVASRNLTNNIVVRVRPEGVHSHNLFRVVTYHKKTNESVALQRFHWFSWFEFERKAL